MFSGSFRHRDRSRQSSMGKGSGCDKNGLKKGAWTQDEDNKLRAYIQRYGHWNWSLLPKFAGVSRSGKSCRLRWMNYLRPDIKHGNFTEEEDNVIISLHNKIGNKWSTIATHLPGRSDNEIKNRWNTRLKKQVQDDQTMSGSEHIGTIEADQANLKVNPIKEIDLELQQEDEVLFPGVPLESPSSPSSTRLLSSWLSGIDDTGSSDLIPQTSDYETFENFWTDPFFEDNNSIIPSGDYLWSPSNFENDFIAQSFGQDMLMTDEFLWSTFGTYVENNMDTN